MKNAIVIETASFENLGGWLVETQSIRQIGYAYLMAHGMGIPVADASTSIGIAEDGIFDLWAFTRNWIEEWSPGKYPGRFEILVDGSATTVQDRQPAILGTNGKDWGWQYGGRVSLSAGTHALSLHDLTGFNGRCASVCLVPSSIGTPCPPPEGKPKRETEESELDCDLIVIGGGIAGSCVAIAAARCGVRSLCLQDRGMLGGCNSSEVRVGMGGVVGEGPYPELGRVVNEIQPLMSDCNPHEAKYYEDDRKAIAFDTKTKYYGAKWGVPGVPATVRFNQHVFAVEKEAGSNRIDAVIALDVRTGKCIRYKAKWFCDASGDAVVSRLAGCTTMYGREERARFHEACAPIKADKQVMGMSIQWLSEERENDSPFPDISEWALKMDETTGAYNLLGTWDQESGFFRDMADDTEAIRDYGLLSVFSNWHWVKNLSPRKDEFAKRAFSWISPVGGKRESYRVYGDYVFNQNDLQNQVFHPDGTATATWNIDFHFPDPRLDGKFKEPIRSAAYHRGFGGLPVPVPYRCLYAKDCDNLFLAGRIISVSHAAFACIRVMRTLGALGEAVGIAASICNGHDCTPRDVYTKFLEEYRSRLASGVPRLSTFHPGGFRIEEAYHMNSRGWFKIYPAEKGTLPTDAIADIKAMGYTHMNEHPDLQDRRRRLLLLDESRGFLHYHDSFSPKACFKVPIDKHGRDLKPVGENHWRIVSPSGFQIIDMNERKVVDEFKDPLFDTLTPVAICDLDEGGFAVAANSEAGFCVLIYGNDRKLSRKVSFATLHGASSMHPAADGNWLFSHGKGIALIMIPEHGETGTIIDNIANPADHEIVEVVQDKYSCGFVAGCKDGCVLRLSANCEVEKCFAIPTDTGKESHVCAQVVTQPNGHIFTAHWTGPSENDSFKGWQVLEYDENGNVVWFLDSPDRYGSISALAILE